MKRVKKIVSLLTTISMMASFGAVRVGAEPLRAFPHTYDFEDFTKEGLTLQQASTSGMWAGDINTGKYATFTEMGGVFGRALKIDEQNWNMRIQSMWYNTKTGAYFKNDDTLLYSYAIKLGENFRPHKNSLIYKRNSDGVEPYASLSSFEQEDNDTKKFKVLTADWSATDPKAAAVWAAPEGWSKLDVDKWYYINYKMDLGNQLTEIVLLDENGNKIGETSKKGFRRQINEADTYTSNPRFNISVVGDGAARDTTPAYYDNFTTAIYNDAAAKVIKSNSSDVKLVGTDSGVLSLRFDQSYDAANNFNDASNITITAADGTPFTDFTTVASDFGGIKLQLSKALKEGTEYTISFNNELKTVFGQSVADYKFKTTVIKPSKFYCNFEDCTTSDPADSGWIVEKKGEDQTGVSAAVEDTESAHGKAIHIVQPAKNTNCIVSKSFDESYADNRIINFSFKSANPRTRYIYIGGTRILRLQNGGGIFGPNGWFANINEGSEWNHISIKMNVKTGEYEIIQLTDDGTPQRENQSTRMGTVSNLPANGIDSIKIESLAITDNNTTLEAEDFWIDDISIADYAEKVQPISTDVNGKTITIKYPTYFVNSTRADTEHMTVTKTVNGVEKNVSFTAEPFINGTKIELDELPLSNVRYKVAFNGVSDKYGQTAADCTFTGTVSPIAVAVSQEGTALSSLADADATKQLTAALTVRTGLDETKTVNTYMALYDSDGKLAGVTSSSAQVTDNNVFDMNLSLEGITDLTGYTLRFYAWDAGNKAVTSSLRF